MEGQPAGQKCPEINPDRERIRECEIEKGKAGEDKGCVVGCEGRYNDRKVQQSSGAGKGTGPWAAPGRGRGRSVGCYEDKPQSTPTLLRGCTPHSGKEGQGWEFPKAVAIWQDVGSWTPSSPERSGTGPGLRLLGLDSWILVEAGPGMSIPGSEEKGLRRLAPGSWHRMAPATSTRLGHIPPPDHPVPNSLQSHSRDNVLFSH